MTIPQALQTAVHHHQAGRLADAEALYRQILAVQPTHAEALHLLGVIAQQVGRHDLAVEWINQAAVLNPKNPAAHSNLGLPELVAHTETEYVNIAARLATDIPRLTQLRSTLRNRMKTSVLMDAPRFAQNVEAAYRSMWQRWCATQPPKLD